MDVSTPMAPHYRHTQKGWVILVSAVLVAAVAIPPVVSAHYVLGSITLCVVLGVMLGGFGFMTVTVDGTSIEARLGVGIIKKRILFSELRSYRRVQNPWYYGWGIRFFPGGVLYNVSGMDAVEFVLTSGKRVRFGTDEASVLLAAIRKAAGKPQPLNPTEALKLKARARKFALLAGVLGGLLIGALVTQIVLETRQPNVQLSDHEISVRAFIYGTEVPARDIIELNLKNHLPPIRLRTNGLALGSTLRGHFRLDELGDGQLFIEAGKPPYVIVRTTNDYVVINFAEPDRTRQLYDRLRAWRGAR